MFALQHTIGGTF